MAITWRFWQKTGKTFFRSRIEFDIDADALEFAVAYHHWVKPSDWSKAKILESVRYLLNEKGNTENWFIDSLVDHDTEAERLLSSARKIVSKYMPEAYQNFKK